MKKQSRWPAILILTLFLAVGGVYLLVQTTWPLEQFLLSALRQNLPQIKVKKLTVYDHYLTKEGNFVIEQLSLELIWQDKDYHVIIDRAVLSQWRDLFKEPRQAVLAVKGMHLISHDVRVSNGWARLTYLGKADDQWSVNGYAAIPHTVYLKQGIESIEAKFLVTPQSLTVPHFRANVLKGDVSGEFVLDYKDNLPYSMNVSLEGLNTSLLPREVSALNEQINGVLNGSLKVRGNTQQIIYVQAHVNAPQGAYVNPLLLQFLTNYIPQSVQKKHLDEIIKKGDNVFFDRFVFDVTNDNNNRLKTAFDMESVDLNLDIDLTVDINVDAGLLNLMHSASQFLPREAQ